MPPAFYVGDRVVYTTGYPNELMGEEGCVVKMIPQPTNDAFAVRFDNGKVVVTLPCHLQLVTPKRRSQIR